MSGYVATWDGVASSTLDGLVIQKVRRGMTGNVRDRRVQVAGLDGDILFPERRGNRKIVAEFVIVGAPGGQRHDRVVDVAEWVDKTGYKKLIFDDQPDRYWEAALAADPDPDEWRSLGEGQFEWTAKPYAYATTVTQQCVDAASAAAKSLVLADKVDAYPVIVVTARGGGITGPIILTVNGLSLTYAGSLAQNQSITISSLTYTVDSGGLTDLELTGAYTPGTAFPADVTGEFPILVEGANPWSIQWSGGTATHAEVCFNWRRRYQ